MTERYFEKFPLVNYSNNSVVDITRRVVLLEKVSSNPYVFYPYEISDNERADQFSYRYFEDPYQSWILYLTNKIVDPYYEWYLTQEELNEFIEKKYGSYYDAQQKIKFYKNNWYGVENISLSAYNALSSDMKKYWEPSYGVGTNILSYSRKQVDWSTTTNKIISYGVSNTSFIKDEICDIVFDSTYSGKGQVISTSNAAVYIQHVSGYYYTSPSVSITGSSYIYGNESQTNTIFTSVTAVANNISEEEINYWTPVTYYDYENDKNEYNKSIRIIDKSLSQVASDNLKDLLKE